MLQSRQCGACSRILAFGVSILSLAIAGCGGGGGGGGDGPTSPSKAQTPPAEQTPLEKTPLAFTMGTAQDAASKSIREVELSLIYTRFAIQVLDRPNIPLGTSTRNCTVSGTETVIFSDVDNNGTPGKGDTVTVRYDSCRDDVSLTLKGQYTLSLTAPIAAGTSAGVVQFAQFNATVPDNSTNATQIGGTQTDGAQSSAAPASLQLDGNVTFSSVVSDTVEQLAARTDDKGLKMQSLDVTNPYSETLILNNAQKNLDRVSATYQVILDTVLQSQRLRGQIEVSTPNTVTGSLNAFPTGGSFRVKGAVAVVDVYGTPLSTSKVDMRYSDSNSQNVSLGSPDWRDLCSRFYFWDTAYGSPEKDVVPTPPDVLYNSIPTNGILSTTPEITVQLARPLDGAVKPVFVFQPQQSSAPSVNADVIVSGAHVQLKMPAGVSLQPMTIYDVVSDKASYPAANNVASLVIPSFTFSTE